jgi:hypothetical protein
MPLSASDIRSAFEALSDDLGREGHRAEIVVAGGAALVLLFGARESTKDVDAFFVTPEAALVRSAAARVADRIGLPADWLNDGAKGYFVGVTNGEVLYKSAVLTVRSVSMEQLLGMKLGAWRDAVDRADAKLVLARLHGDKEAIWSAVKRYVTPADLNKASYAFDDLWDATHGS